MQSPPTALPPVPTYAGGPCHLPESPHPSPVPKLPSLLPGATGVGWGLRQHPWWQPRQRPPPARPPHGPQMGVRRPPPAPSPMPPASLTNLCDGKGAREVPGEDSSKKAPVCLCPAAFRASAVAPLGGPGLVRIGATGGIRRLGGMKDAPVGGILGPQQDSIS